MILYRIFMKILNYMKIKTGRRPEETDEIRRDGRNGKIIEKRTIDF